MAPACKGLARQARRHGVAARLGPATENDVAASGLLRHGELMEACFDGAKHGEGRMVPQWLAWWSMASRLWLRDRGGAPRLAPTVDEDRRGSLLVRVARLA
jgi:hypothetical protein